MDKDHGGTRWLDQPIFSSFPIFNREVFIFSIIIILAVVSRLYDLGARAFSHDENLHVYFSWLYSIGKGYQHTPLMHGPLQFHILALTYILLGASDFIARFPHAIASVMTIILVWKWRRYLGRAGVLVTSVLLVISPFVLYYGRYARNEAFIGVFFVLTLYSILRYLETGKKRYIILLTISTALHFTSKETAFIYTAQAMLFLGFLLINRVARVPWKNDKIRISFIITLATGLLLALCGISTFIYQHFSNISISSQTAAPILPGQSIGSTITPIQQLGIGSILLITSVFAFLLSITLLLTGYGWRRLCKERSFDMIVLLGTFVLPQLAAFPASALGWNPLEYNFQWPGWNIPALWAQAPVKTLLIFLILCIISVAVGLYWNKRHWPIYGAIFWGIYIIFYTSIFSYWQGFFTGTVGSLGYWLQQQGVHRGDQPWYYYILIQIPIYEFLPALGVCLAIYLGIRKQSPAPLPKNETKIQIVPSEKTKEIAIDQGPAEIELIAESNYTFPLLIWWAMSSLFAFTIAGEKMPWLTFHIALPMILLTGWALGQVIERFDWKESLKLNGALKVVSIALLIIGLAGVIFILLGNKLPFSGKTSEQLSTTNMLLYSIVIVLACSALLYYFRKTWKAKDAQRLTILIIFFFLAILTGRTAFRAAIENADNAMEYLVYAHGANGIKDVMEQISQISSRIAGEKNLKIAYDNNSPNQGVSWSFKWYLRDYPNAFAFDIPGNYLNDVPVILVDQQNFEKIKPIVGNNYYQIDYIRMVWPNQDYFGLTWQRLINAITNPSLREAIFQIWLFRDYSAYAKATGERGLTLTDWQPSSRMRLFVRKDLAAQLWDYGIIKATAIQIDPYEKAMMTLSPELSIGGQGSAAAALNAPRGSAIAPDGSIYIADSRNNRIEHFDADGNFVNALGKTTPGCPYSTTPPPNPAPGTFCEPWGVAISSDGRWLYVADTWNHRIQKLATDGAPEKSWGIPNYDPVSSGPFGLWGPRDVDVDAHNHVLVADTGNKRIIIYDSNGNFLAQFGGEGVNLGQFDEPVGLAFDTRGNLYVADTWNQRIQVFASTNSDGTSYTAFSEWNISGWTSQSLDNKPFIAIDQFDHIFASVPDESRILEFNTSGEILHAWSIIGNPPDNIGVPSGISVDKQERIWISDANGDRILRFVIP